VLRRLGKNQLAGFRYAWDRWDVYDQEEGGLLLSENVAGNEASTYSAIGPLWQWDSRDHVFFPTQGLWAEAALLTNTDALGATQNFVKWTLDVRKYWSPKENRVWAAQLYLEGNSGAPPFNQLALLGGTRLLRGYYEGRFRDRQMAASQVEYRFPIKGRFGAVAFGSIGSVVDEWKNWEGDYLRYALGAGLRFTLLPKDKIRLRLDYGIGPNSSAFYLTVGEAF
jgi:outer membrane protein assembly factor BamA